MKRVIFPFLVLVGTFFADAQNVDIPKSNRWSYGGGAGLSISGGYYGTNVSVYPRVGYLVSDDLEMGLSSDFSWTTSKYHTSIMIGVGPYANYYVNRTIYIFGRYSHYFYHQKNKINDNKYAGNEPALYLGGGYIQRVGNSAYMQFGAYYNVLYKEESSVLGSGFCPSVGIVFGL